MRSKDECGCVHDGTHWTRLCAIHEKEETATHAQWLADYQRTVNRILPAPAKPLEHDDWLNG